MNQTNSVQRIVLSRAVLSRLGVVCVCVYRLVSRRMRRDTPLLPSCSPLCHCLAVWRLER